MNELFDNSTNAVCRFTGAPYQRHSETSRAAAEAIAPKLNALQQKVLDYIRSQGAHGSTDNEAQAALGMSGSTERPRRIELTKAGLLVAAGKRDSCTVWMSV